MGIAIWVQDGNGVVRGRRHGDHEMDNISDEFILAHGHDFLIRTAAGRIVAFGAVLGQVFEEDHPESDQQEFVQFLTMACHSEEEEEVLFRNPVSGKWFAPPGWTNFGD